MEFSLSVSRTTALKYPSKMNPQVLVIIAGNQNNGSDMESATEYPSTQIRFFVATLGTNSKCVCCKEYFLPI